MEILFALVCVFLTILCVLLTKRYRKMQQQLDLIDDYVHYLLEKEEMPADAGGADDLSE